MEMVGRSVVAKGPGGRRMDRWGREGLYGREHTLYGAPMADACYYTPVQANSVHNPRVSPNGNCGLQLMTLSV